MLLRTIDDNVKKHFDFGSDDFGMIEIVFLRMPENKSSEVLFPIGYCLLLGIFFQ